MSSNLKKSAERVQTALNEFGFELNVMELSDSTRTAQEATNIIGCSVSQIAKSLIFKGKTSKKPILYDFSVISFMRSSGTVPSKLIEFQCTSFVLGSLFL